MAGLNKAFLGKIYLVAGLLAVSLAVVGVMARPERPTSPADPKDRPKSTILVFAPHPDDESLGCAGVILRASRLGIRVRVVFVTSGDGFPRAAAALAQKDVKALTAADFLALGRARQQQALDAARLLGLSADSLVFLGYPDAGLAKLPGETNDPTYRSAFTRKNGTYGLLFPDYHAQAHGAPGPYRAAAVRDDMTELIRTWEPGQIYVTDPADHHPDHRVTFELVHSAAAAAAFGGELFTYLIHSGGGPWPWPVGANPDAPFEAHVVKGKTVPADVPWPPDDRRPMTHEEAAVKLKAIQAYTLETQLSKSYVESFVKSEEVFWRKRVPRGHE